jgi:peptidoglycan/LPS O-acetylase OafA/YrhL
MSGFLITGILIASKAKKEGYFRNFYARRFLRILPIYYGFLAVYFFVMPHFMDMANNPESAYTFVSQNQGWYWAHFANFLLFFQGDWLGEMSHFWSLAVEEHFYFVWPLAVYFLSGRALFWLSAAGIAASTALRAYWMYDVAMSPVSVYVMTFTRVDSLLMGAMLAVMASEAKDYAKLVKLRMPLSWAALASFVALVGMYVADGHFAATGEALKTQQQGHLYTHVVVWGYLLMGVASSALIVWLLTGPEKHWLRRLFEVRFFRTLGVYSYGMYIIHFAVFGLFHQSPLNIPGLTPALGRPLAVFVSFTLPFLVTFWGAWALFHGYEKQFLKLKKYFEYRAPKAKLMHSPAAVGAET